MTSPAGPVCDNCRKVRATYHLTNLEAGQVRERHLCHACTRSVSLDLPSWMPWEPPAEDWLSDADKKRLVCPSCRHVNADDWNFCSACGAMREP